MRKLFALFVAAIVAISFASYVYAGSADARTATTGKGISQVNGLGDLSTGNTAEIDSSGNVYVRPFQQGTVVSSTGATLNTGTQLITGAANIQSISLSGQGSAGDYCILYDNTSATGTPVWEISAGTAKNTVYIDAKGGAVTNGIFADSNADTVFLSVIYD